MRLETVKIDAAFRGNHEDHESLAMILAGR